MRRLSSSLPSPAMLVALLALFVALGGSAYATEQRWGVLFHNTSGEPLTEQVTAHAICGYA